jgi:hypothetical protein
MSGGKRSRVQRWWCVSPQAGHTSWAPTAPCDCPTRGRPCAPMAKWRSVSRFCLGSEILGAARGVDTGGTACCGSPWPAPPPCGLEPETSPDTPSGPTSSAMFTSRRSSSRLADLARVSEGAVSDWLHVASSATVARTRSRRASSRLLEKRGPVSAMTATAPSRGRACPRQD